MYADPHEPAERLAPFRKQLQHEDFLFELNQQLASVPLPPLGDFEHSARLPVVYVVGVPRSGTTVLHQLIAKHLNVGYINNLIARFWRRPSIGIALSRAVLRAEQQRLMPLESRYGVTEGVEGAHEFGYFWRYWLHLDEQPTHHLSEEAQSKVDEAGLGEALRQEILSPFGLPVAFKNPICGFHASLLTRVHPHSLFIHIRRPHAETVRSILQARLARFGTFQAWWSLKPSSYPFGDYADRPVDEVARQVLHSSLEIEAELARPEVQSFSIDYAELCNEPRVVLEALQRQLARQGFTHDLIGSVPSTLPYGRATPLPDSLEGELPIALRSAAEELSSGD